MCKLRRNCSLRAVSPFPPVFFKRLVPQNPRLVWERVKSLRAISPFPTVFSKGLFPRGVKRCHCMGMG